MAVRVGINGFGRIGRNLFRVAFSDPDIDIVCINDLADAGTLAHLLKYDSVHGTFPHEVESKEDALLVGDRSIRMTQEKDPAHLPWKEMDVDIVVEATGRFVDRSSAQKHIAAGSRKVIISAPGKSPDVTVVLGVNEDHYNPKKHHVVSNASCTTNCLAPLVKVLSDHFGIKRGLMTTVHSYTNDQQLLDLPHKDLRRARSANLSMIPTTTGAAKALSIVLPELEGKLDGMAIRVPTPNVSLIDLVVELETDVTEDSVRALLSSAAQGKMTGILQYTELPLVSVDLRGNPHSCIVDGTLTKVIGDRMAKVIAWYDNEWGYSCRVRDLIRFITGKQ
ncbi:MAG: type I glyceraldehyde-3-phosphate dehydrogenase [Nitrospira sp.]|nr:type I glyceraldehyde-3-phosphate dehydrogenase [Candidatus Manganitrophaceae bacterium]HIL34130.1 type I glyceraldehyde-3-phosphate dehydrogenase [Candidatus Manganitrophaceae bacterium]